MNLLQRINTVAESKKNSALFTSQLLAEQIIAFKADQLSSQTYEMAERCVLDIISAALSGQANPSVLAFRNSALSLFPGGSTSLWFSDDLLTPPGAALVNSAAASALDLDDGNRSAGGHPGASIIPACLAVAESSQCDALDFLAAVVLGYEVAVRISAARDLAVLETFSTGRWCGFGAACASAWLTGLRPIVTANAMSIAGIYSPLQSVSAISRVGHGTKEGIPWATMTGLIALELAQNGLQGPLDILDLPPYSSEKIVSGFGSRWVIHDTYHKIYSCCRWIHAAIDALLSLMGENDLDAKMIHSVFVLTFKRAVQLKNQLNPESLEAAQFSVPYCLALTALYGPEILQPMGYQAIGLSEVSDWAQRVHLQIDPQIEMNFPGQAGARVVLGTEKGEFSRLVEHPYGDPVFPLERNALEVKFLQLAQDKLTDEQMQCILRAVSGLSSGNLKPLVLALQSSLS